MELNVDEDTAAAAALAAEERHLSVPDYIGQLVRADTGTGDRAHDVFIDSAREFLAEYGDYIEERVSAAHG